MLSGFCQEALSLLYSTLVNEEIGSFELIFCHSSYHLNHLRAALFFSNLKPFQCFNSVYYYLEVHRWLTWLWDEIQVFTLMVAICIFEPQNASVNFLNTGHLLNKSPRETAIYSCSVLHIVERCKPACTTNKHKTGFLPLVQKKVVK